MAIEQIYLTVIFQVFDLFPGEMSNLESTMLPKTTAVLKEDPKILPHCSCELTAVAFTFTTAPFGNFDVVPDSMDYIQKGEEG